MESPHHLSHANRIGTARFNIKHWEERLAVAMADAEDAGMEPEEVERRAGRHMTVAKARSVVEHIEGCTVRKHKHLRLHKHRLASTTLSA